MERVQRALVGFAFLGAALVGSAAPAQAQVDAPCPPEVGTEVDCYSGQAHRGAFYWIAVPRSWNGILILHAHGGPRLAGPRPDGPVEDLRRYGSLAVREGYAWAASTYRRGGYGVTMAARDTDALRAIFTERFEKPRLTFVHGQSWGGNVAAKLIELVPRDPDGTRAYHGALLTNGVLAGGTRAYLFRADLRAVYQFYCRNHPRPTEEPYSVADGLPLGSDLTIRDLESRIDDCTGVRRRPEERTALQKQNLANILNVIRIPERSLISHVDWATYLFRDLVERRLDGDNPFSNEGVVYSGSSDDTALNAGVERFAADPDGVAKLAVDADPTGQVDIPVVSLHAIGDPTAFVEHESAYRETLQGAGRAGNLVQVFTEYPSHSAIQPAEFVSVLEALRGWVEGGAKPTPSGIAEACPRVAPRAGGECLLKPDYVPPPFFSRTYPRKP